MARIRSECDADLTDLIVQEVGDFIWRSLNGHVMH
jgi:hypothetical protein